MTQEAPLTELERRYQALKREIATETRHLSADDLQIVALKRQKLLLKDRIFKLRHVPPGAQPPRMH